MFVQCPAGEINQQIDAPSLTMNLGEHSLELRSLGQLNRAIFRLTSLLAQLFGRLGCGLLILVENKNRIAGFAQAPHYRLPDAARATVNHSNFCFHIFSVVVRVPVPIRPLRYGPTGLLRATELLSRIPE